MDVTAGAAWVGLLIALVGAGSGIWSLCWQYRSKRQEKGQVVVRSWWEAHNVKMDVERVFVVEAHNVGTKDAAAIVAVGAELFFPAGLEALDQTVAEHTTDAERQRHWWLRDIGLIHQESSLTGAATEPVTLAAQHRVTYRFVDAIVRRTTRRTDRFWPIVELATGEFVSGDEASPAPDRDTIRLAWIDPPPPGEM